MNKSTAMLKPTLELSMALAKTQFKLRNEGSYLGALWYPLNPLLVLTLLLLVFSDKLGQNIPHYPLYLLLGVIMFNFFQQATIEATKIIEQYRGVIKSINFPRVAIVNSIILKMLFFHGFDIIVFMLIMTVLGVPLWGFALYPFLLIFFMFFVLGIALSLSALTLYFADLGNIWIFALRLFFFGTPIFYAIDKQHPLFLVNLFNPLHCFITIARDIVIYIKPPELWLIGGVIGHTAISLTLGFFIFRRLKSRFAEMI